MSRLENVDYEMIPSNEKDDGWNVRILTGQFVETVIEFGAVRFNEIQDNMSFSFEVISSPDSDITTENVDLQIEAGEILESVISIGLDEGSVMMREKRENDEKVELTMLKDGDLSIDGQTKPAGNIHLEEYEDGDIVGGCYATYENVGNKLKEIFDAE